MSETPTEQPTVPAWLDKNYVEKVFQHITENRLDAIHDYKIELATSKGENYLSTIYLLTVNYSTTDEGVEPETKSLIIKSRLDSQLMTDIEVDLNVYSREVQVYSVLMQEFNSLLRKIGDETEIGPSALYIDDRIIVLENLKTKGYCIEDVKRGLNFEQCSVILRKLAKFHALSMVLYKKSPELFKQHLPGNITEHPSPLHEMYKNTVRTTIEYCKTQPALAEYVPKLSAFGDIIIPKMINVFSRNQADRYHVLNHGDVWVNNMMFKKNDDDNIQDVLFVDFQEGFFGSPGIDFNFFIFSSWQTDVLENHYAELLEIYHKNLIDILHAHNYEQRIPTIRDVEKEIINKSLHGLATATCLLPLLINEYPELSDPTHFLFDSEESNANRKKIIDNPAFGRRLEVFLKFFKDNGVL